jgi:hypothetical protein
MSMEPPSMIAVTGLNQGNLSVGERISTVDLLVLVFGSAAFDTVNIIYFS